MRLNARVRRLAPYISFYLIILSACHSSPPAISGANYLDSLAHISGADVRDSSAYFDKIDSLCRTIAPAGDFRAWCRHYWQYNFYYYQSGNYPAALRHADSMVRLSQSFHFGNTGAVLDARSLLMEGNVFLAEQLFAPAFEKFVGAREIMSLTPDNFALADYAHSMATATFNRKRYAESLTFHRELMARERDCYPSGSFSSISHLQGTWDNIGICFVRLDQPDSAIRNFDSALTLLHTRANSFPDEDLFFKTATAIVQGNKGDALLMAGDSSAAERIWLESIRTNSLPGYENGDALFTRLKLGNLFLFKRRLPELKQTLQQVAAGLDTLREPGLRERYLRLQYRYDSASGNWREAAMTGGKIVDMQDSLDREAVRTDAINMDTALSILITNARLPLLERQTRFHAWLIAILLLCLIMGLTIIFLIIRQYRQSQKNIQTLRNNLASLAKSQESNSRVMKVVAHDLRNPVSAMMTIAEMLLTKKVTPSSEQEFLKHLHRSGHDAIRLIDDILQYQVNAAIFSPERMQLRDMLEHCCFLLKHKTDEKQQSIHLSGPPVYIMGDREKLWRVFSNLLTNAVKFSHPGTSISVRIIPEAGRVLVATEDRGIGIPANIRDKIFTPAAKRKGTAGEPTFGLGLMICRQIIEQHKGNIWFESEEGKGTTFYVELPL
ncbi:MAG: HAMP domain-containing histidine kinase [Bacteroidetes bacterium]|nr:HAMP domain-containing histidine kinase [Bacteroidota bacterium]